MEINELLEIINECKTMRICFKEQISVIERNIKEFLKDSPYLVKIIPLIFKRKLKEKSFALKGSDECGICIDALENIIEDKKGKKLDAKQLKDIDYALNTYILPLGVLCEIRMLYRKHNIDFNINNIEYMKKYYENERNILINYRVSREDIKAYDKITKPIINSFENQDSTKSKKKVKKH